MTNNIQRLHDEIIIRMKLCNYFCTECKNKNLMECTDKQKEKCDFDFDTIAHEAAKYKGKIIEVKK